MQRNLNLPPGAIDEQHRLLLEVVTEDAIFLLDAEGRVTALNPAAERLFGWTLADLAGQPLPSGRQLLAQAGGSPGPQATGQMYEDVFSRRNGAAVHVRCQSVPLLREGRAAGYALVVRDLTEMMEGRAAASRHAQQLRRLAEVATRINAVHDLDSLLAVITEEARALIGAHQAVTSLHGEGSAQPVHRASLSDRYAGWRVPSGLVTQTGLHALACRINRPMRFTQAELEDHLAGPFAQEAGLPPLRGWLAAPLTAPDGGNLGLLQVSDKDEGDFTEGDESILVQLAQMASVAIENARLYQQLKEADRHKDEFLSMLAHELRNPLAPVRTAVEILELKGTPTSDLKWAREVIGRQVQHLVRIVDDLLDVTRIVRGTIELKRERLDLSDVVRTTAEDYARTLEQAGLALRVEVPSHPVCVTGDFTRLAQVLSNLLDNARKFTERGGQVSVRLTTSGREAVLSVRDTGIGIARDMLPGLFDVFAQADRSIHRTKGGLGLGLALVKGLSELHGGRTEVLSDGHGKGAEFVVRLPLEQEPPALTVVPADPVRVAVPLRILIVEDNRDAADSLCMLLGVLGHEVRVAYSGPAGVTEARAWKPDAVLCDIGLPGLDGYGVARAIRQNPATARARLIAITGYGQDRDRQRCWDAGFDGHLTKPADPDLLLAFLKRPRSP